MGIPSTISKCPDAHRVGDVDGFAHDVHLASVRAPVIRPQVRNLKAVVVADADPGKESKR